MYVHFLHRSSTSILFSNPFFMFFALGVFSISSMVLSLMFPRGMVALLSRQQGISVALESMPMYLERAWQYPFSDRTLSFGFGQVKDSS